MKDKIHWTWKKILGTVLGILGIGTLTSCYGMPEDFYSISGTVKGKINGTTQAIPGIQVAVKDSKGYTGTEKTDSDGKFSISDLFDGNCTVTFTDVDGDENGSFKEKTLEISLTDDWEKTITLEENAQ